MPISSSAKKRLRQSEKRRIQNRTRKSRLKTVEKRFLAAITEKKNDAALLALNNCFSEFDKAAKVGIIHANQANRKKARLTAKMKAFAQAQGAAPSVQETPASV
ncbi:MAG: 30S ribosomal protein S20 [Lentisphaerae bacterium RIFOXYB12_FULL_65_16]|nr:MAG: 30S ribosomal protein S20 [Lentisphaerae bacterium RIFOXYA12_64_32]OGV84356.1 MAG: 30S ribosomal protein S20 [Lentisphaerae bacterium RIFOXYB12_FULL_65_16]